MTLPLGRATNPYYFPPESLPLPPNAGLTDDERTLFNRLAARSDIYRGQMFVDDTFYNGTQVVDNLKIAIPDELSHIRSIVGWPRMAVDPLVERLRLDGFRMPGQTDADEDLLAAWRMSEMDSEQALLFTDVFALGRGYLLVGSPEEKGGQPVITAESPQNVIVLWDARGREPIAALQSYWSDKTRHGALLLPSKTIHMVEDPKDGHWVVSDVDAHNFGRLPLVRAANTPRSSMRDGFSEITPEIKSITLAACRTLLGLEVAREFYSVPQKIILGATEADFIGKDGTPKSAFDTYISSMLGLSRSEDGQLPEVKQFTAYDPGVYTKLIEMYASQMAGILQAPPQDLGLYTQGNPVSAEAAQASQSNRNRRARAKQAMLTAAMRKTAQLVLMFQNGGTLPKGAELLEVDWLDPDEPAPGVISDAMFKQVSMGAVPATSDVTLAKLGYGALERERLAADREKDQGQSLLAEIANSVVGKEARVDSRLLKSTEGSNGAASNSSGGGAPAGPGGAGGAPSLLGARRNAAPGPAQSGGQ